MAIEPISSIMTVQAQGSVSSKAQAPARTEKPEGEDAGRQTMQAAAKVDKTTSIVENTREKDQTDSEDQQGKDQQATHEKIRKAVEQLNKSMANSEAVFGIHEDTNRVTIKIIDKTTKEVIRELPPEKTLDMIARVWDMAGLFVDERK